MPIDIPQAQLNYFEEHHYLELEDYLSEAQVTTLRAAIQKHLKKQDFDTSYLEGHDLWRKDATIKKTVLSRDLAHILSQLTKIKPMQIGFDQVLQTSPSTFKFTKKPCLLKEISSVGPAIGGLLINLSQDAIETDAPLPQAPGNLLFFGAELPLPFPDLVTLPDQLFLLIVYCNLKPRYLACPNDPHSHKLKKQGYGTGDHLTTDTHPLLIN